MARRAQERLRYARRWHKSSPFVSQTAIATARRANAPRPASRPSETMRRAAFCSGIHARTEPAALAQLVEVNAHSLFSKWFSESGKVGHSRSRACGARPRTVGCTESGQTLFRAPSAPTHPKSAVHSRAEARGGGGLHSSSTSSSTRFVTSSTIPTCAAPPCPRVYCAPGRTSVQTDVHGFQRPGER
jgi:hypothetical protein